MSKLNKTQRYAVQWLKSTGLSVEDISKELNITAKQISSVIPNEIVEDTSNNTNTSSVLSAKDLMITHTSGKKINSVAIMTKEASEIADSVKKQAPIADSNRDNKKCIFRPKK